MWGSFLVGWIPPPPPEDQLKPAGQPTQPGTHLEQRAVGPAGNAKLAAEALEDGEACRGGGVVGCGGWYSG